jgi:hypothetical protein
MPKYKAVRDKDGFYIVKVKYFLIPFWIEYGINVFTHYTDAINYINFLCSLNKNRKINKIS